MAVPILFAEIGEAAIQFTDTAFLGRVGPADLAAIGLVDSLLEFAIAPLIGIIEAMQIFVARRRGGRREGDIVATFNRTLRIVLVAGMAIAVLLRVGTEAYADAVVASAAVAAAVVDFFRYGALGVLFLTLNLAYSSLYVGIGRTRILISATILLVGSNLVISYALVLGHFGAPRLGIEGGGIAFAAAQAIALAFMAVSAARQLDVGRRGLIGARIHGGLSTARLARLGSPISAQVLTETLRWVVFFLIVERIGEDALAASSMIYAAYALLLIPASAFTETVYSLVSNMIGRGDAHGVPKLMRAALARAYVITLPFVGFAALWPETALAVFTTDQATIDTAAGPLRVIALVMVIVIPAEIWLAAVFATGDTLAGAAIEIAASGVMLAGAYAAALSLDLDLAYVWATLAGAAMLSLAASYARVRTGRWVDL